MKKFKGKAIYNPSGKAGEYSYWAVNFYNGCSVNCDYCYCKKGFMKKLWSTTPTIKKSLIDENTALEIFKKEVDRNSEELQGHGLFFNFTSDPFLPDTIELNTEAMYYCESKNIPVKALTKQTWWIGLHKPPRNTSIGFTLTGMDELEGDTATNMDRIKSMKVLKNRGFNIWASIEPVIDLGISYNMIKMSISSVSHFKIGTLSGEEYNSHDLRNFIRNINYLAKQHRGKTIYWKDEILKKAGVKRDLLPYFCVDRDFNFQK